MATFIGFDFPFQKSAASLPAQVSDDDLIRASLQQIVLTSPGERVMRPTFGCDAIRFVFDNNNDLLSTQVANEVRTAIARFEPRVIVQQVNTFRNDSVLTIEINYIVRLTQQAQQLSINVPTN